jgi:methylmalonyl-CoA mutase N-terminal domain/subunit
MNADQQLFQFYDRWRELTSSEGQAIAATDWTRLQQCQAEKRLLQDQIKAAAEQRQREQPAGAEAMVVTGRFRNVVDELIALEECNARALAGQRAALEQQQRDLHQAGRTLRQLHAAYATGPQTAWQSYS